MWLYKNNNNVFEQIKEVLLLLWTNINTFEVIIAKNQNVETDPLITKEGQLQDLWKKTIFTKEKCYKIYCNTGSEPAVKYRMPKSRNVKCKDW